LVAASLTPACSNSSVNAFAKGERILRWSNYDSVYQIWNRAKETDFWNLFQRYLERSNPVKSLSEVCALGSDGTASRLQSWKRWNDCDRLCEEVDARGDREDVLM
jgi:hypothetical protein